VQLSEWGTFPRRTGTMGHVSHPRDYERSDADLRLIGALALGIAIFLLIAPYALLALFPGADHAGRLPAELPQSPAPRLQVQPKADLDRLRADESQRLTTYGWVDRKQRVVRISIEQAIDLLVGRGIAGWPLPSPPAAR
jgi:hypothetical protein